ncbi:MAG: hypothetical protein U0796_05295 [Gemmatales bacterium]
MCLLMIFGGMAMLLMVVFIKSAMVLLPWTITAGVLAGLTGLGLGKLSRGSKSLKLGIGMACSLVLTVVYGYFGYMLIKPPGAVPRQGIEQLLTLPDPTQDDLWQMLPVHLAIVGIITAVIVSRYWYRWSPELSMVPEMGEVAEEPAGEEPPMGV